MSPSYTQASRIYTDAIPATIALPRLQVYARPSLAFPYTIRSSYTQIELRTAMSLRSTATVRTFATAGSCSVQNSPMPSTTPSSAVAAPSIAFTPASYKSVNDEDRSHTPLLSEANLVAKQIESDLNKEWRNPNEWKDWYGGIERKSRTPNALQFYRDDLKEAKTHGIRADDADDEDRVVGRKVARSRFRQIWVEQVQNERRRAERLRIPLSALELYIIDQWCLKKHAEMFPCAMRKK